MMQLAQPFGISDPFEPSVLRHRRRSAVQFLGNALFTDRAHGAALVKRVLAKMPMPTPSSTRFQARRKSL
jgi:TetR/AcrR family transcriptional regulator